MSWRESLSELLMGVAVVGTGAVVLQRLGLAAHMSGLSESGRRLNGAVSTAPRRGISILKPLAGLDDGLAQNLEMFAAMSYAPYELLLGVSSTSDAAYPLAQDIAKRHPQTTRVVVQQGAPGLNPKVNQLSSLERAAKHDIILISDSNVRPPIGYLDEVSQLFDDPTVGCTTNPAPGMGHKTFGAMMDNLEMCTQASRAVAGHALAGINVVVGKSQGLRRDVLRRLGGFAAYANVLAEDYLIGRDVQRLGYKVAYGKLPVFSYAERKGPMDFMNRASRWSTMQATASGSIVPSLGMALLNPVPLALGALALSPSWGVAKTAAIITGVKVAADMTAAMSLGVQPLGWSEAMMIPVKDVVAFGAHVIGTVNRTVTWRGHKLQVGHETRLTATLPADAQQPAQLPEALPTSAPESVPGRAAAAPVPARTRFGPPRRGGQRARLRGSVPGRRTGSR